MIDYEAKFAELALELATLRGHSDGNVGLIQKLLNDLPKLKTEIEALKQRMSNHQCAVADVKNQNDKTNSLVANIREEFSRNLTTEVQNLVRNIEDKHTIIAATTADNNYKVQGFESRLEDIALDAKNAVLKANNAEMVTTLNKKKVENVHLMVKNFIPT
jgi:hypothetical protein